MIGHMKKTKEERDEANRSNRMRYYYKNKVMENRKSIDRNNSRKMGVIVSDGDKLGDIFGSLGELGNCGNGVSGSREA